jgi:hypothetical protein
MRRRNSALSRRGFVVASTAILVPKQEEGPFYLDAEMRADHHACWIA